MFDFLIVFLALGLFRFRKAIWDEIYNIYDCTFEPDDDYYPHVSCREPMGDSQNTDAALARAQWFATGDD